MNLGEFVLSERLLHKRFENSSGSFLGRGRPKPTYAPVRVWQLQQQGDGDHPDPLLLLWQLVNRMRYAPLMRCMAVRQGPWQAIGHESKAGSLDVCRRALDMMHAADRTS